MNVLAIAAPALVGLILAGLVLALFFGGLVIAELLAAFRVPLLPDSAKPPVQADTPTRRFKGQSFERAWQGSLGYEQAPSATDSGDWVDRIIVPTVTALRPSQFKNRSYWTRYLPSAALLWLLLFIVIPSVAWLATQPTTGPLSTFIPTPAQRAISSPVRSGRLPTESVTKTRSNCRSTYVNGALSPLVISDVDDGTLFGIRPGDRVVVSAAYGRILFSAGIPLCPDGSGYRYVTTNAGTGFIFLPEPAGTAVVAIQVVSSRPNVVLLFAFVSFAVMVIDTLLLLLLRRLNRQRWS